MFVVSFLILLIEQFVSDFYYFDRNSVVEGLGLFLVEALVFTVFYLAVPTIGGFLSFWALVWIAAYISVRWQEHRSGRKNPA